MNRNLIAAKVRYGLATQDELAALSTDDLVAIKGDDGAPHYRFSDGLVPAEAVDTKAAGGLKEREHEHVFSTERRDSMGDKIMVAGWNLERVKSALPVFYAHDSRDIPVGVVKRAWRGKLPEGFPESAERENAKALIGRYGIHEKATFGEGEAFGEKAEAVQALLEARVIRGGSVGFIPDEIHYPESKEEAESLGLGRWGVLFKRQTLLEWSITPIPANPDAQKLKSAAQEARSAGATVLKSLVDGGSLLPDAADELLDAIFSEDAYAFLKGEGKTVVAMDAALDELFGDEEDDGAVELEERDATDETLSDDAEGGDSVGVGASVTGEGEGAEKSEEPRNTPDPDLAVVAKTLEQVTTVLERLTEATKGLAEANQHILERFEELKDLTSKSVEGEGSPAPAGVDDPGRPGTSRVDDPEEFAESVMRDVLSGLQESGAHDQTHDRGDHPQDES